VNRNARAWSWLCVVLSVPGLCLALVQWPTVAIVVTYVLMTFLAAMAIVLQRSARRQEADRSAAQGWLPTATAAVLVGSTVVSLAATFELSANLALLVALAMVGSSPWALSTLRRLRRSAPVSPSAPYEPPAEMPPVGVESSVVRELSNAELCTAWRASYTALQRATSPTARARLVANRQCYLDEMESRNPTALSAWLASGARAASGPERYLGNEPGTQC
jgi:hypothetical protein